MHEDARAAEHTCPVLKKIPAAAAFTAASQIGILKDDVGGLAAQLERDTLEVSSCCLKDLPTHDRGTGEGHLVDVRMTHKGGSRGLPIAGHHVQYPGRNARLERQLADAQRGQRGELRGLQHDCATAGQRRRDLPHADHQRKIPRDDRPDYAQWFAHGIGQSVRSGRNDLTVDLVRPAGVIGQRIEHRRQILAADGGDRLARVQTFQLDQLVEMLTDSLRESQQQLASLRGAQLTPLALEGRTRRLDGCIDVGRITLRHLGDWPLRGRIEASGSTALRQPVPGLRG